MATFNISAVMLICALKDTLKEFNFQEVSNKGLHPICNWGENEE